MSLRVLSLRDFYRTDEIFEKDFDIGAIDYYDTPFEGYLSVNTLGMIFYSKCFYEYKGFLFRFLQVK